MTNREVNTKSVHSLRRSWARIAAGEWRADAACCGEWIMTGVRYSLGCGDAAAAGCVTGVL